MKLFERGDGGARVTRAWEGRKVICLASGPSVTQEQLELVRAARERDVARVICVNDMYLVAPWADVVYFADSAWYTLQVQGLERSWPWVKFKAGEVSKAWEEFAGEKATIVWPGSVEHPKVFALKNNGIEGLSRNADSISTGRNGGYQALNIAVLSGGKPIALVGYDMRYLANRSHSHNGHQRRMPPDVYRDFAKSFSTTEHPLRELGVAVVNCTPGSLIEVYRRMELASFLASA